MDCTNASDAVRTCECGDGVQCPNERNPIRFTCTSSYLLARVRGADGHRQIALHHVARHINRPAAKNVVPRCHALRIPEPLGGLAAVESIRHDEEVSGASPAVERDPAA